MHETGFKAALTRVLNNYGVAKGIIKGDDKVSGEDCRASPPLTLLWQLHRLVLPLNCWKT